MNIYGVCGAPKVSAYKNNNLNNGNLQANTGDVAFKGGRESTSTARGSDGRGGTKH